MSQHQFNIDRFNVETQSVARLRKLWRKVTAWFATLEAGKNIRFNRRQIQNFARRVVRELSKRGQKFNVEQMKPSTRRLFILAGGRAAERKYKTVDKADKQDTIAFEAKPKDYDDMSLMYYFNLMHDEHARMAKQETVKIGGDVWSIDRLIKYYAVILKEMDKRGFKTIRRSQLDEAVKPIAKSDDLMPGEDRGHPDVPAQDQVAPPDSQLARLTSADVEKLVDTIKSLNTPDDEYELSESVRKAIPDKFHYWKTTGHAACMVRTALVKAIKDEEVQLDFKELIIKILDTE